MDKNQVVLQLTLKILENFEYKIDDYGGNTLNELADSSANIAASVYNTIHSKIDIQE